MVENAVIDELMASKVVLFLGAGFSSWSADLPTAKDLFNFTIQPFGKRESNRLRQVILLKRSWDKDNPHGQPEHFIEWVTKNLSEEEKHQVLWYVVRVLSEPFIYSEFHAGRERRHVLEIDENRKYNIKGVASAQRFLGKFSQRLGGIITTNYDMLVEYALGTKGFNYGVPKEVLSGRGPYPVSQWLHPVTLTGQLPLAKIHGSVSWDGQNHYSEGRRGLTGKALIVAPAASKDIPDSLKPAWSLAKQILRNSSRIAIFGFGFNRYDRAVWDLLRSTSESMNSVLLISTTSRRAEAQEIWEDAVITEAPPPPVGDLIIDVWVQAKAQ